MSMKKKKTIFASPIFIAFDENNWCVRQFALNFSNNTKALEANGKSGKLTFSFGRFEWMMGRIDINLLILIIIFTAFPNEKLSHAHCTLLNCPITKIVWFGKSISETSYLLYWCFFGTRSIAFIKNSEKEVDYNLLNR